MKFATTFALLGLAITVVALPSNYEPRGTHNIRRRSEWDEQTYQERSDISKDFSEERDISDHDFLDARYLDSAYGLSEREYQEIEKRITSGQIEAATTVIPLAVSGINGVVNQVKGVISQDKQKRDQWTKTMADSLKQKYPQFNWIICHVKHNINFKGQKGKDWDHAHQELNVHFLKTVGFEIYHFGDGTFDRIGDGGYLNWAYNGNVVSSSSDGKASGILCTSLGNGFPT